MKGKFGGFGKECPRHKEIGVHYCAKCREYLCEMCTKAHAGHSILYEPSLKALLKYEVEMNLLRDLKMDTGAMRKSLMELEAKIRETEKEIDSSLDSLHGKKVFELKRYGNISEKDLDFSKIEKSSEAKVYGFQELAETPYGKEILKLEGGEILKRLMYIKNNIKSNLNQELANLINVSSHKFSQKGFEFGENSIVSFPKMNMYYFMPNTKKV